MYGNTGKIIVVDLTAGKIEVESLPETDYLSYIGGSGLAARLFWERGNIQADPLSAEAMLIFMNGPFAGLKLSGASRSSVAGRSPLTGNWGDSSCGGYFAPELRYAGFDGIILTGKAERPSLLVIEDSTIRIESAEAYWGKGIESVNRDLKKKFGKTWQSHHRPRRGKPGKICHDPERGPSCIRPGRIRGGNGIQEFKGHRG